MNKNRLIIFTFLIAIAAVAVYFNTNKPRVMILHSYHPDYAWTRDVNVGIRRVADNWEHYSVMWHYMDTKKHRDKRWHEQASLIARHAVETAEPDVLIIVDDLAQKLVGSHYVNHPNMNIVFAGVNGSVEPYNYIGADNVTGIFERKQLQAIKETVLALEKGRSSQRKLRPRVVYMIDSSPSLQKGLGYFRNFDWAPIIFRGAIPIDNFAQWQSTVKDIDQIADYLLVANYRKLITNEENPSIPAPRSVMTWTEQNSAIPVVGVNVFNTEEGAMLSVGVSPYEQGETAARMAEKIIEEKISASDIPFQDNLMYVVAMNDAALERRGIVMPSIYEAFGRATANYHEE